MLAVLCRDRATRFASDVVVVVLLPSRRQSSNHLLRYSVLLSSYNLPPLPLRTSAPPALFLPTTPRHSLLQNALQLDIQVDQLISNPARCCSHRNSTKIARHDGSSTRQKPPSITLPSLLTIHHELPFLRKLFGDPHGARCCLSVLISPSSLCHTLIIPK